MNKRKFLLSVLILAFCAGVCGIASSCVNPFSWRSGGETSNSSERHIHISEWEIIIEPTCTSTGIKHKKCTSCGELLEIEIIPMQHNLVYHEGKEPACTENGWKPYATCINCNYSTYEVVLAYGHLFVNGYCSRCGVKAYEDTRSDLCPVCENEISTYCRHGDDVYFGTYPQTLVTNEYLSAVLDEKAGDLPNGSAANGWTSYGYYSNGFVMDYMRFKDVSYNGARYRGVYLTGFRPHQTSNGSSADSSSQDEYGYELFKTYWFKFEPIKWRILIETNGLATLFCDTIIDSQPFYNLMEGGTRVIDGETVYENDYGHSSVRTWLNFVFLGWAFSDLQLSLIEYSDTDNSALSTNPYTMVFNDGGINEYSCENTMDRVWLLSEREVTCPGFGFDEDPRANDAARIKKNTDYARIQGAGENYGGNGTWWLRSPSRNLSYFALYVSADGLSYYVDYVNNTSHGIVPALKLRMSSAESSVSDLCPVCGEEITTYCRHGEDVYFGAYPQTREEDEALVLALNTLAGALPKESNGKGWTSYGYYANGVQADYMWYIDISYKGTMYRGVYFSDYRPHCTTEINSVDRSGQDENGFVPLKVYWFKFEPIKWKILKESDGEATLLCDMIIDSGEYYITGDGSTRLIDGATVYENNYEYSAIRTWLNYDFYNLAFGELQRDLIQAVSVDNGPKSCRPDTLWNGEANKYACENTFDKVWLLSEQEVTYAGYGFDENQNAHDTARRKKNTDYALLQGAGAMTIEQYRGDGAWWLRSPNCNGFSFLAQHISYEGGANAAFQVNYTFFGVVPAVKIRL